MPGWLSALLNSPFAWLHRCGFRGRSADWAHQVVVVASGDPGRGRLPRHDLAREEVVPSYAKRGSCLSRWAILLPPRFLSSRACGFGL